MRSLEDQWLLICDMLSAIAICFGTSNHRFAISMIVEHWSFISSQNSDLPHHYQGPLISDVWYASASNHWLSIRHMENGHKLKLIIFKFSLYLLVLRGKNSTCSSIWSESPLWDFHIPLDRLFRAPSFGEGMIWDLCAFKYWNMAENISSPLHLFYSWNTFCRRWQHIEHNIQGDWLPYVQSMVRQGVYCSSRLLGKPLCLFTPLFCLFF